MNALKDDHQEEDTFKRTGHAKSFQSLLSSQQLEENRKIMEEESTRLREHIRRRRKWTLDPHSWTVSRWDAATTVALLFTAIVTPFEVGVLHALPLEESLTDPLFWLNRVVDIIFLMDIVLQSFIAFQEPVENGGRWVYNNWRILGHYARGWMLLDVVTAVPVDFIVSFYDSGEHDDAGGGMLQLIRMLRLVKLGRILRASRIFHRWQAYLGMTFSVMALLEFMVLVTVMAHWLACLWVLFGRSQFHVLSDGTNGANYGDPHAAFGSNWLSKAGLEDATPRQVYGVALYIAFSNIFSGSCGTIPPASPSEYYIQSLMMLVGSSVWAYVISSACGILATLNPNQASAAQRLHRHRHRHRHLLQSPRRRRKRPRWSSRRWWTTSRSNLPNPTPTLTPSKSRS